MKKYHQGWYPLSNPEKYIKPADGYMKSTKLYDGKIFIQYKSSLEKNAIKYADLNPKVLKWSQEPFCIQYIKKVIVEIKPYDQTIPPKKPKKMTSKQIINYKDSVMTYIVNKAKWNSASNFAKSKGLKFVILTEKQLNPSKT